MCALVVQRTGRVCNIDEQVTENGWQGQFFAPPSTCASVRLTGENRQPLCRRPLYQSEIE